MKLLIVLYKVIHVYKNTEAFKFSSLSRLPLSKNTRL